MEEMIQLSHPQGKKGARIRADKYNIIKNEILSVIQKHKHIAYKQLIEEVKTNLKGKFEGSVTWYVTAVKLDLEARKIIERYTDQKLQFLKLAAE